MKQRDPNLIQGESGFTILEVMISAAIMTITILGASLQYVSQLQSETGIRMQMQNRILLNQVLTHLSNSPSLFPRLSNFNDVPAIYVACFNERGGQVPNAIPGSQALGFVGVFVEVTNLGLTRPFSASNGGQAVCDLPTGGFEVHVSWPTDAKYGAAALIDAVVVLNKAKSYNVASKSIRAVVTP